MHWAHLRRMSHCDVGMPIAKWYALRQLDGKTSKICILRHAEQFYLHRSPFQLCACRSKSHELLELHGAQLRSCFVTPCSTSEEESHMAIWNLPEIRRKGARAILNNLRQSLIFVEENSPIERQSLRLDLSSSFADRGEEPCATISAPLFPAEE